MSILQIRNLHVSVEGKEILKGINLEIKTGEFHVIMGPNGTGKSTLASTVMGHYKYEVTKGEIALTAKTCWRCRLTKDRAKAYFCHAKTKLNQRGNECGFYQNCSSGTSSGRRTYLAFQIHQNSRQSKRGTQDAQRFAAPLCQRRFFGWRKKTQRNSADENPETEIRDTRRNRFRP